MNDYFDLDGRPIDQAAWAQLFKHDRHIGLDTEGEVTVSTVWLGLNHNWSGLDPPLIFETMVFGGAYHEYCQRYSTKAQALAGHDQAVAMVREKAARL
jgi:hypothetical protein